MIPQQVIFIAFRNGEEMRCAIELHDNGSYFVGWRRRIDGEPVADREHFSHRITTPLSAFGDLMTVARDWAYSRRSPIIEIDNKGNFLHIDKASEVQCLKSLGIKNVLIL